MKFIYGKNDWVNMQRGQENCYLLTNGLGGYSSMTMIGSVARNDHALFMACLKAPTKRIHMITGLDETVSLRGSQYPLSSQEYVGYTKNRKGYVYLQQFRFDILPEWTYQLEGIEITKTIVLKQGENTLGIRYRVENRMKDEVELLLTPQLQFVAKGESICQNQDFKATDCSIESNGMKLYYQTNAATRFYPTKYVEDLYYAYDSRDGRDAVGKTAHNHSLCFKVLPGQETECTVIYSTKPVEGTFDQMVIDERDRIKVLIENSGIQDEQGKQLVQSADQFIVHRESTGGKSIIAGYPFFADWGRDTMIALSGCCISTRRFEDTKSIFRTFMKYCDKGLMPNMFPEDGNDPLYNTVDASLLFIGAVYDYFLESGDKAFVEEALPVMEDIITWYRKGTDYHIRMDSDGLLVAGSGLEQVTWMDVRFGDILPTPRHGKPVEINAYWYNDLKILESLVSITGKDGGEYGRLAEQVKNSFCTQFWNGEKKCLKDVFSGEAADLQIRCNQIWAVSLPFTMLSKEQEKQVVDKVFEVLYTPYGLRSLDPEDKSFHPNYGGSLYNRDMAYHQGTVWTFPIGGYYLAYLKVNDYNNKAVKKVKDQLAVMEACLREGCIGQIAEIYDGENPTVSRGCFAQAWSVSEILRVYAALEKHQGI